MIQQAGLREVLEQIPETHYVEVETNGGFASEIDEFIDHYNCSPKLKGSGNKSYELKLKDFSKTWYRFVIDQQEDVEESLAFIKREGIPRDRVSFSPQCTSREEQLQKLPWLAELCKDLHIRLSPRLHILLWGNQRGT